MSVYIIAHKSFNIPDEEGYIPLQVGAERGHTLPEDSVFDDCGDNISEKNSNYCELTGIYWLWKHCSDDYIGVVHYRRYFSHRYNGALLKDNEIKKLLEKHDIILPFHHVLSKTVREQYCESGYEKDLIHVGDIIKSKYPEYYEVFEQVMAGKRIYFFNMFITTKKIFREYSEWLFDILTEAEKVIDLSGYDSYHQRIYGFISERLLYVYVLKNQFKAFETGVVNTEENWGIKKRFLTGLKREILYFIQR